MLWGLGALGFFQDAHGLGVPAFPLFQVGLRGLRVVSAVLGAYVGGYGVELAFGLEHGFVAGGELAVAAEDFQFASADGCATLQVDDDAQGVAEGFQFQADGVDGVVGACFVVGHDGEQVGVVYPCDGADAGYAFGGGAGGFAVDALRGIGQFDGFAEVFVHGVHVGLHGLLVTGHGGGPGCGHACGDLDGIHRLTGLLRFARRRFVILRTSGQQASDH